MFVGVNVTALAQNEYLLVGKTPGQVYYEIGNSYYSTAPSGKILTTRFYYHLKGGGTLGLDFESNSNYCQYAVVEHPIMTQTQCQRIRGNVITNLKKKGFKYWKTDNDIILYWSPNYIARFEINYMGGTHAGYDDYGLTITYMKNVFNH